MNYRELSNNSSLHRNPPWSHLCLTPLPMYRDEERHQYCWEPTEEWLAFNTTVISNQKSPEALANIERYRHVWQPRGEKVHWCLQQRMLGELKPDPGDYEEWTKPLLEHEFWKNFEPLAVEHMLCDLEKSVGGQLDLLGYDHKDNKLVLIDLKTQGKQTAKPYSTDAQLGSYCEGIKKHHDLEVESCRTVWARPGKCVFGKEQEPEKCLDKWDAAWQKFKESMEVF